jgi:hypothetical protein
MGADGVGFSISVWILDMSRVAWAIQMNYLDSSSRYELRIDPQYWMFQNWFNIRMSVPAISYDPPLS